MSSDSIRIIGAREHNLQNITVEIPRERLTVITGLSGSGKSSLAFDTLYAEGQRRYVESLSAYARQFLDQFQKPDVERLEGLSPAVAIEQRTAGSNPRSIVATSTEVHDYLRLLYANLGVPHCTKCGERLTRQTVQQVVDSLLQYPARTRLMLLAPVVRGRKGEHAEALEALRKAGFIRARIDGDLVELEYAPALDRKREHTIEVVVDRLIVTAKIRTRLSDSVELAMRQGGGLMIAAVSADGTKWTESIHSEKQACAKCSVSYETLTTRHFSFNSPYGACPTCAGLGMRLVFDEGLVVSDSSLPLDKGAIQPWRKGPKRLIVYYKHIQRSLAKHYGFSMETPFKTLPARIRRKLLWGSGTEIVEFSTWRSGAQRKAKRAFEGVIPNLERRYLTSESEYMKQVLRRFMTRQVCPDCEGRRLRPETIACTVGGQSIVDVTAMSVTNALEFFEAMTLSGYEQRVAGEIQREVIRRLRFLSEVGLGYLTLDRESGTLSGGEAQRIRLATQIGSGLVGVIYVLDEPTIGLHPRDTERLISVLKGLRDLGNTVVVVEHDEQMIRSADHIIDMGPGAGRHGGRVVFAGDLKQLLKHQESLTGRYLGGRARIRVPESRKRPGKEWLRVQGATHNNLKDINVKIPLGLLVCVTGVSGSGKSTLVDDILRRALFRYFYTAKDRPGAHRRILGKDRLDKVIVIDQSPIGRTPRSNPATYTGAFSHIRTMFAETPASKVRGFGPGRFSFNVKGGRCEKCKGDGMIRIEMHFLPDVYVPCQECGATRYNRDTLGILYGGKTIADVLQMTVDEALEFFANIPAIARKLQTLSEVGLGYLHLGQSATTLSGGEAQRIKLSAELSKKATGRTLYLLDEPTTGLHFADTQRLLQVLQRLRDQGNTVLVIEHNLDVLKVADYIIDLGPEGGDDGGHIVAEGTPEHIEECPESYTGRFLSGVLHHDT